MRTAKRSGGAISLRTGFSTGAYMTATAVTALGLLRDRPAAPRIEILFLDGRLRKVNVDGWARLSRDEACAWSVKDAGEDVDATHGLRIGSRVRRIGPDLSPAGEADLVEPWGDARVVFRGGDGVGIVTRKGLDVPVGKYAINPCPRQMLLKNLQRFGMRPENVLVEVSIENGEAVARRTLNPTLGIRGGLSVLGTTGVVIPCSHEAYIATIAMQIRGAVANCARSIALVTGGRTHAWVKARHPEMPEYAIVRFGDFIREAVETCARQGVAEVLVVCMAGKLAKYALGIPNTHARRHAQSMRAIPGLLRREGWTAAGAPDPETFGTVRGFLEALDTDAFRSAVDILKRNAVRQLQSWGPGMRVELRVLGFDGSGELW